ncbi:MAG: FHA domain-containing protein, partial [Acidobacteriota bacterium]
TVQALAAEVQGVRSAFGDGAVDRVDTFDADMTLSEMSAPGLHARSQPVDALEGLQVAFVRADGPQEGQTYAVTQLPLVIGRLGHGLQINDKRVSSKHAQLEVGGPWIYTLKDLASTNGTLVNGRPISVTRIDNGDHVSFGGVGFTFQTRRA